MPPDDDDQLRPEREAFGANLRAVREHRGMGQRELAAQMAGRRFRWHQNTVTRVEAGDRGVSFFEVQALAAILGVTTDRFTWATPEASAVILIGATHGRLREAWREAADSAARLHAARDAAERSVAEYQGSQYDRVRDAARGLAEDLESGTLEAALDEAEALWQRLRRGEA